MADDKPSRRRGAKTPTFQLTVRACPARCDDGKMPVFEQKLGQFQIVDCERCLGVGVIEAQQE